MNCRTLLLVLQLSLVATLCCVSAEGELNPELNEAWQKFKSVHGKQYSDDGMETVRRLVWESNVKYIAKHNVEYDLGLHTYSLGVNQFTDLTFDEFRATYLGFRKPQLEERGLAQSIFMKPLNVGDLPDTVDWRTKGFVTGVKNQGSCGSCWAFSTTGSMEGQYFRKSGQLVSLSEQQLVDCSLRFGNFGCHGGLMNRAFAYIKDYGIERESDYNYTAHKDDCKYNASKIVTKCTGWVLIPKGHEDTLQYAVATEGPVSVAIDAGHQSFQSYKQGVYNEPACSSSRLDHGVLAVGYGTENGAEYWLVKNSWDTTWGDQGYIKMTRNKKNQCGIATDASYPQL